MAPTGHCDQVSLDIVSPWSHVHQVKVGAGEGDEVVVVEVVMRRELFMCIHSFLFISLELHKTDSVKSFLYVSVQSNVLT